MSFPQLGYPQYLSAAGPGAYGAERPGVLAAAAAAAASSGRPGAAELGSGAGAAAVTSVLGMYAAAGPYPGAPNYSAFLPYAADLSLFSQMVSARGTRGARGKLGAGRAAGHTGQRLEQAKIVLERRRDPAVACVSLSQAPGARLPGEAPILRGSGPRVSVSWAALMDLGPRW